jgi:DNA-binding LacI/PurR family transcriptional regulator
MKNFESLRVPKYVQLMIRLRDQIEEGKLKPGDPLPTRERLMKEFDLSLSTVTRAISELERQGWLVSRQGSGTFVVKRTNGATETNVDSIAVGLLLPSAQPYSQELVTEIVHEANEHNIRVLVMYAPDDEEIELNNARLLFEKEINALIWFPVAPKKHVGVASLFGKNKIPVVIGEKVTDHFDAPWICVRSDYSQGMRSILEYLYELGHRKIAYVGPKGSESDFGPVLERWYTYKDFMKSNNMWNPDEWLINPSVFRDWHAHSGRMENLFRSSNAPTAVIGYDDTIALEAMKGLSALGLRIPEEVAVVGHGDYPGGQYSNPRLTTVSPCHAEYVDAIFRVLMMELAVARGENAVNSQREIVIAPRLLLRDSALAVSNMQVTG